MTVVAAAKGTAPAPSPFTPAAELLGTRGVRALVWGPPKTGKSHFALTFPEPIDYIDLDMGLYPLLGKPAFKGKDIRVFQCHVNETFDPASAADELQRIHEAYCYSIENEPNGTVVIDPINTLWSLVQCVKLAAVRDKRFKVEQGKANSKVTSAEDVRVYPFDYADANRFMSSFLRRAMSVPTKNIVVIGQAKEIYNEAGNATGKLEYQGYKEAPYALDGVIRLGQDGKGGVTGEIALCRADMSLNGVQLENPDYELIRALFLGE